MTLDPNIIITACIAATPPFVIGLMSYFASKRNAKLIYDIHIDINSRMSELIKASKGESHAEGLAEVKAEKIKNI